MKRGWCYLQRNKWSWKISLVFRASAFQIASNGKRIVVSLCCQLCPWCVGNLQEDLCMPFAFKLQKTGNDAMPFVKYMWMKVLIITSAFGLPDVLLSLHTNKEYLNKEISQVVLLFVHTISLSHYLYFYTKNILYWWLHMQCAELWRSISKNAKLWF